MVIRRVFAAFAVLFGLVLDASASTPSNLFVFGDSLSDNGNLAALTSKASFGLLSLPFPNYWNGRISNGPNWVDYFKADEAGIRVANVAVSGAYTGTYLGSDNSLDPQLASVPALGSLMSAAAFGLGTELSLLPNVSGTNSAAVLWIGANDLLSARSNGYATASGAVPNALQNISGAISTLASRGMSEIFVANLPDIGKTPRAAVDGQQVEFTQAVTSFNQGLASIVAGAGPSVKLVDIFTAFNFVLANATTFGFTNTTSGCLSGSFDFTGCSDPSAQRIFWDDVHPSTWTHYILAKVFENAITPKLTLTPTAAVVPVPAALPLLGSALVLLLRIRRA